jgi:hypothetical protein
MSAKQAARPVIGVITALILMAGLGMGADSRFIPKASIQTAFNFQKRLVTSDNSIALSIDHYGLCFEREYAGPSGMFQDVGMKDIDLNAWLIEGMYRCRLSRHAAARFTGGFGKGRTSYTHQGQAYRDEFNVWTVQGQLEVQVLKVLYGGVNLGFRRYVLPTAVQQRCPINASNGMLGFVAGIKTPWGY